VKKVKRKAKTPATKNSWPCYWCKGTGKDIQSCATCRGTGVLHPQPPKPWEPAR